MTSVWSTAQVVVPLENNYDQEEYFKKNSALKLTAAGDTINIPFFDDFTQSNIVPDAAKWIQNGGTYVGSNFAINPPNFNVATFDGVAANGKPYVINQPTKKGAADNLTSLPIDLSGLVNGDSLFLRFFWQGGGLGEIPDQNDDSIVLQLKAKNASNYTWKTVWKESSDSTVGFNLKIVRIGDAASYYYDGFQFRFQSYGRLSGAYDMWNIDYVYLDTGRLVKQNWSPDASFKTQPSSYLKNYAAMPIKQYLANKTNEIADSVCLDLVNLYLKERAYKTLPASSRLIDIKNNEDLEVTSNITDFIEATLLNKPTGSYYYSDTAICYFPNPNTFDLPAIPRILQYSFKSNTNDPVLGQKFRFSTITDSIASPIDFTLNDSVAGITKLTDYYAYDDGTAEAGFGVNTFLGRVAAKYHVNTKDTLTFVDICFPLIQVDHTGEPLEIFVMTNVTSGTNISSSTLLGSEEFLLTHTNPVNGFNRYNFSTPIIIPANTDIFVGYKQSIDGDVIFVGFDRNNDHRDKIFINIFNQWKDVSNDSGSVMIRPGFKNQFITAIDKPSVNSQKELQASVYPNPSKGIFNILAKLKTASVYDLSGKLLFTQEFDNFGTETNSMNLSNLPAGMYVLHLENEEAKTTQRIFITGN